MRYTATFFVILVCLALGFGISDGTYAQSEVGKVVYYQKIQGGYKLVVYPSNTQMENVITLDACPTVSNYLNYIALVSNGDPKILSVYSIASGQIIAQITWQSGWRHCSYRWVNDRKVVIDLDTLDPNQVVEFDIFDGTLSSPYPFDLYAILPNLKPNTSAVLASPSEDLYVYERCDVVVVDTFTGTPNCSGSSSIIVFDTTQQQILTSLEDAQLMPARPVSPVLFYFWSNTSRYLAYTKNIEAFGIYDTQLQSYLNLDFVESYPRRISGSVYGAKWSPDDSQLMAIVNLRDPNTQSYSMGLALVDLRQNILQVLDLSDSQLPYTAGSWEWSPDGESILMIRENKQLIRMDFDGTESGKC